MMRKARVTIVDTVAAESARGWRIATALNGAGFDVEFPVETIVWSNVEQMLETDIVFCHANDLLEPKTMTEPERWHGKVVEAWLHSECAVVFYSGHGVSVCGVPQNSTLYIQTNEINSNGIQTNGITSDHCKDLVVLFHDAVLVGDEMAVVDAVHAWADARDLGAATATQKLREVLTQFDDVLELKLSLLDSIAEGNEPSNVWLKASYSTREELIRESLISLELIAADCANQKGLEDLIHTLNEAGSDLDNFPFANCPVQRIHKLFFR
jgi:hypothetical protein